MSTTRRKFMQGAASFSALGVATPGLLGNGTRGLDPATGSDVPGFQPDLMPSQKEVWEWETWFAKLGPKPTGSAAQKTFVDFLDKQFQSAGIKTIREPMERFPLWQERRTELTVNPNDGQSFKATVVGSYPTSGETSAQGVTGEVVYAGASPNVNHAGLKGKIALTDFTVAPRDYWKAWSTVWGTVPPELVPPASVLLARAFIPRTSLEEFKRAGAIGVIYAWNNVSDANAAHQYMPPPSAPEVGLPALYVGPGTLEKLRSMALGQGGKATLVLEVDREPDVSVDHVIAPLPGANASDSDEIIIINTHTDGTNAVEENGGIALVALAKYFSKIPQSQRNRTFMFIAESGHMGGPYDHGLRAVPDVLRRHPDYVKRAVGALTIEHLGCMEWVDDATLTNYHPTGKPDVGYAYAPLKCEGELMLKGFQGNGSRTVVCTPTGGPTGESEALQAAGVPAWGFIGTPNYLWAAYPASQDGGLEKCDGDVMYRQIQSFAKMIHMMDAHKGAMCV